MTGTWIERRERLTFNLGEIRLFAWTFPFKSLDAHFSRLTPQPSAPPVPLDEVPGQFVGMLVRSQPVQQRQKRVIRLPNALCYVPRQYPRYFINMEHSFADYLAHFSKKTRETLKRKNRKFAELCGGLIDWRVYRTPQEMADFYLQGRQVSCRTYQERLLGAGLPDSAGFMDELKSLAERDSVRGFVLMRQGAPVAYLYCPIRDGVVNYQFLGYDPQMADWSPGTVLLYHAIESLFAEGRFRIFDFGEGQNDQKRLFATSVTDCADFYYFRPTLKHHVLLRLHAFSAVISAGVGRVLQTVGLKRAVKAFIRRKWKD